MKISYRKGGTMIGAKIKEYLQEHGIKQSFIAQQTGLTDQIISDICNRDRKVDALENYKICKVLELPSDYFVKQILE